MIDAVEDDRFTFDLICPLVHVSGLLGRIAVCLDT